MPHPTVIIELRENAFEALYSNIELSFIIVNHDDDDVDDDDDDNDNESKITGPYAPTLEKPDLSHVVKGVHIPPEILAEPAREPYY